MDTSADRSYDADVPNKTIYVSDGDLPLYQRAQELAGGNLSAAIASRAPPLRRRRGGPARGLRRDHRSGRARQAAGRSASPASSSASGSTRRPAASRPSASTASRTGKFVVHIERSARLHDGRRRGQAGRLARLPGHRQTSATGSTPGESTLEVVEIARRASRADPAAALRHGRRLGRAAGRRGPRHLTDRLGRPRRRWAVRHDRRDRTPQPVAIQRDPACASRIGKQVVLDGIDLEVAEGTVFALLGPNGAGKTTTVHILSTLIAADGGHGRGRRPRRRPRARRASAPPSA